MHYEKKDYELAHQDYDWAIDIEPNNPRYWHSKGLAFEGVEDTQDNIDQAIKMYK